jgi:hypothetical protein
MNLEEQIKKHFAAFGRIGGKKAAANMTPEARRERATKAVQKREEKKRQEKIDALKIVNKE